MANALEPFWRWGFLSLPLERGALLRMFRGNALDRPGVYVEQALADEPLTWIAQPLTSDTDRWKERMCTDRIPTSKRRTPSSRGLHCLHPQVSRHAPGAVRLPLPHIRAASSKAQVARILEDRSATTSRCDGGNRPCHRACHFSSRRWQAKKVERR